jgi:hypothetical protein
LHSRGLSFAPLKVLGKAASIVRATLQPASLREAKPRDLSRFHLKRCLVSHVLVGAGTTQQRDAEATDAHQVELRFGDPRCGVREARVPRPRWRRQDGSPRARPQGR